ncbi:MAG: hypothetical protein AAGH79_00405 [Bacteroidota bacterium]
MPQQLLDSNQTPRPSNFQVISPWIVLAIGTLGLIWSALVGVILRPGQLGGLLFAVLAMVITFSRPTIGVKVTVGVLLLAVLNIISFFPISNTIELQILGFPVFFEVGSLILLIIHFRANRGVLRPWVRSMIRREVPKAEQEAAARTRINGYKRNLDKKSTDELRNILEESQLVPEALQAAQELIDERKPPESELS